MKFTVLLEDGHKSLTCLTGHAFVVFVPAVTYVGLLNRYCFLLSIQLFIYLP